MHGVHSNNSNAVFSRELSWNFCLQVPEMTLKLQNIGISQYESKADPGINCTLKETSFAGIVSKR